MENAIQSTGKNSGSLHIALIGYGKMGKAIEEAAILAGHHIALKITSQNTDELTAANLSSCNVAIEFTTPDKAAGNILTCINAGIPVVCGTTGWLEQLPAVQQYCADNNGSLLYASNFSIGVNIFFEINKKLAFLMAAREEYDVTIEEIHHTAKKDSPSGTAITIADQILASLPRKKYWANDALQQEQAQLTITSKRIDPTPGTHKVKYSSVADEIEIIHTAHSRKGFAEGALIAATFIKDKKGIFTMKDVLGIR